MDMAKAEPKIKEEPKVQLPAKVRPALLERLDNYCKTGPFVRNSIVEVALEEYLDRKEKEIGKKKS